MSTTSHHSKDDVSPNLSRRCGRGPCSGGNWSALNIVSMVLGFVFFWPIGLFILFWIISGRDVKDLPNAARQLWQRTGDRLGANPVHRANSGNEVFNEYQQAQKERIREIEDEIKSRDQRFREFRAQSRRRADEEEFNQFMADAPMREGV